MADFTEITFRLGTGAAVAGPDDVKQIVDAGYTHVIDCIKGSDDTPLFADHESVSVLYNGTDDDGKHKSVYWFDKSIRFALDALTHKKAKVYAHCAAGYNRGPSTCYAIMLALGYPADDAEAMIRSKRSVGLAYAHDAQHAVNGRWLPGPKTR